MKQKFHILYFRFYYISLQIALLIHASFIFYVIIFTFFFFTQNYAICNFVILQETVKLFHIVILPAHYWYTQKNNQNLVEG